MTGNGAMRHTLLEAPPRWTPDGDALARLPDALRQALAAYGLTTRRRLLPEVARHLGASGDEALTAIRRALDGLEAAGDALPGSYGRVAAAPVQVVRVLGGEALLVGGVPTSAVLEAFPDLAVAEAAPRRLAGPDEVLTALAPRFDGCEVTSEAWAGLDASPPADEGWVGALAPRFLAAEVAGTLERLDAFPEDGRQWYRPASAARPQGLGWTSGPAPAEPALVRWRDGRADWNHAWLPAGAWPRALLLTRDEAARTRFALDRRAGGHPPVSATTAEGVVALRVEGRLPMAEYRYLAASGRLLSREARAAVYAVPAAAWEDVARVLRERLGLPV